MTPARIEQIIRRKEEIAFQAGVEFAAQCFSVSAEKVQRDQVFAARLQQIATVMRETAPSAAIIWANPEAENDGKV